MTDPMSREEYADALADLDATIAGVDLTMCESHVPDAQRIEDALRCLTSATLAVAKGVRLLAEPPPVEVVAEPSGTFGIVRTDEERAEDRDPHR